MIGDAVAPQVADGPGHRRDGPRTRESAPKGALEITAGQRDQVQDTSPVRLLSDSTKTMLLSQFGADELRHLAALKAAGAPGLRARQKLDRASVEELAEMLLDGRTPTIGWWRRHTTNQNLVTNGGRHYASGEAA